MVPNQCLPAHRYHLLVTSCSIGIVPPPKPLVHVDPSLMRLALLEDPHRKSPYT